MLDVTGYLARLGLDHPGPPSVEGLAAVHRAQVERIAYTTVDIQRGRPPGIDPQESAARIVATGRGGYCFHLNGALSVLLAALGFDVRRHRGGVRSGSEPPLEPYANHLALTVHGLPGAGNPGGVWFVDAGLGDALYEPVPLRSGTVTQTGFGYHLRASSALPGGWRFEHDPRGSFRTMDFEAREATMADFAAGHADLSTSPTSGFVQRLTAQRRHAGGHTKLVNLSLLRIGADGETTERVASADELRQVLADEFRLPLDDFEPGEWAAVYARARAGQEEYERGLEHA